MLSFFSSGALFDASMEGWFDGAVGLDGGGWSNGAAVLDGGGWFDGAAVLDGGGVPDGDVELLRFASRKARRRIF